MLNFYMRRAGLPSSDLCVFCGATNIRSPNMKARLAVLTLTYSVADALESCELTLKLESAI